MKIGFIGAGNMASAIIHGLRESGMAGEDIWIYDVSSEACDRLEAACDVTVCPSGSSVVSSCDVLVLAVKPQVLPKAIPPLRDALLSSEPLVISIAAGKDLAYLRTLLEVELPLVRVMPNLCAQVGEAMSAFCTNNLVTDEHRALVKRIFGACGEVMELPEDKFSVFSVLAGCSPAYTMMYMDAMAQAGVRYGLSKETALRIVCQAVLGTARLLAENDCSPAQWTDRVCSPAGTTIEGVLTLKQTGFEASVQSAVEAACLRDEEIRRG